MRTVVVFRRRDTRPLGRILYEAIWPRGGWSRAFQYVQHRLHRLPGTPEQIARGIFAGAFVVYTPFFGLHFFLAAFLAMLMRGNVVAALLATFIGNPLTYLPIAFVSLRTGNLLLGQGGDTVPDGRVFASFGRATGDLWHNFLALFTEERAEWSRLLEFYDAVFFPWMVGGIIPGLLTGIVCYYLSVPLIRAYQKRRAARVRKKREKKIARMRAQSGDAPKS